MILTRTDSFKEKNRFLDVAAIVLGAGAKAHVL